jgi:hypothetical protein
MGLLALSIRILIVFFSIIVIILRPLLILESLNTSFTFFIFIDS